jgi:hypothetical protein
MLSLETEARVAQIFLNIVQFDKKVFVLHIAK